MNAQTKEYPFVVQQIHNEFNLAGERLLQEAETILQKSKSKDLAKITNLINLGFSNVNEVKRSESLIRQNEDTEKICEIIKSYNIKYPSYKFIRHEDVVSINKKYGLHLSGIENYIGFVPEKNVNDINRFRSNHRIQNIRFFIESINIFQMALHFWDCKAKRQLKEHLKAINYTIIAETQNGANNVLESIFSLYSSKTYNSNYISNHGVSFSKKPSFLICAPSKDFVKRTIFQELFSPIATKFQNVPDPIVLYPVEHGYIIVTAWGDEASDPLIANENMN